MEAAPNPPGPGLEETKIFWENYARDPGTSLTKLHKEFGPVARIATPSGKFMTCLIGPDANHYVLSANHHKFQNSGAFNYLNKIAPKSILAVDGAYHTKVRRLLMPSLHRKRVDQYLDTMERVTSRVLADWPIDTPMEMAQKTRELTLQIVSKALLDLALGTQCFEETAKAINITAQYITPGSMAERRKRVSRKEFKRAKEWLQSFVSELVSERREQEIDRDDFLSGLIFSVDEDGSRLSDDEIWEQMWSFFFSSHDTTATAIVWAFYLLSQNPNAVIKSRQELNQVLVDRPIEISDFERLPYLDGITKETLRLYSPASAIPRIAREDFEFDGYLIPAGDLVVCNIFITHRLAELFNQPDAFTPERWDPKHGEKIPPFSYIPFSIGPRTCPGGHFAILEIKEVLSQAIRRYDFILEPNQDILAYTAPPAMRPVPGMMMRVRRP